MRSQVKADDVDDVVQLAAARSIERAETLHDPRTVVAWLYRIHRNLIIDTHRKQSRDGEFLDRGVPVPDEPVAPLDEFCRCSVRQAERLRPSYASILLLVDAGGLQLGEAARRLDVTTNNAAVRLHRARTALRTAMLEHCGVRDLSECGVCRCVEDACCEA